MYVLLRTFYKFIHVFLIIKENISWFQLSIVIYKIEMFFLNITLAILSSPVIKCSRVLLVQPSQKVF